LDNNLAAVITVGTWMIANPDFVERLKLEAPLNVPDKNTIYAGGAEGYTDYPFLKE
jgi:N-ethylmaleimide reductase